jgi:methyl-galactoside transport system substrate-binding protein
LNDAKNQGKATLNLAAALAQGTDLSKVGYDITDGKYIWVPYKKILKANIADAK